jgi:hypothetical protein
MTRSTRRMLPGLCCLATRPLCRRPTTA